MSVIITCSACRCVGVSPYLEDRATEAGVGCGRRRRVRVANDVGQM